MTNVEMIELIEAALAGDTETVERIASLHLFGFDLVVARKRAVRLIEDSPLFAQGKEQAEDDLESKIDAEREFSYDDGHAVGREEGRHKGWDEAIQLLRDKGMTAAADLLDEPVLVEVAS